MKNPLSRLANDTFIYGLGSVLNRFIGILLLPLFTHYLTPQDYGVVALVGLISIVLSGIFSLGTGSSMGICYYETEDRKERDYIIWTTAATTLINTLFWSVLGWFTASNISLLMFQTTNYELSICLSIMTLALSTVVTPFWSYLRMENKAKIYVALTSFSTLLSLALSIFFVVYLKSGILGMYQSQLWAQIFTLLITLVVVSPSLKWGIDSSIIKPLIQIGFPSIFGIGAFFVIDYSDRTLLQYFTNTAEVGLYSLGYGFGRLILLPVDAFSTAWPAYFISFINKRSEAEIIFGQVLRHYIFTIGTLVLPFFAFARPVVELITASEFHSIYTVVGIVALSYLFKGCYLILLPGIVFAKKLIIQTNIEWVAAGVNIVLNLLFIPLWHKEGAAISTLLSYCSLPILTYFWGDKYLKVYYDWSTIGKWLISFIIAASSLIYCSHLPSMIVQIILGFLVIIIYCFYLLYGILSQDERYILQQILKNKLLGKL